MLSRVAERIYWLARYLERAENTARLVSTYHFLLLDLPKGAQVGWRALPVITGGQTQFAERYARADERNTLRFLLADAANPGSLVNSVAWARENFRTSREELPGEAWERINELHLFVTEGVASALARGGRFEFLSGVIRRCQQLTGLLHGVMSRGHAYDFIELGRHLERADMTSRVIDIGTQGHPLSDLPRDEAVQLDVHVWTSILKALTAYQMYRKDLRIAVNDSDVAAYLLHDGNFPRSVRYCLNEIEASLGNLPLHRDMLRRVRSASHLLAQIKPAELGAAGLHQGLDGLQIGICAIHEGIRETWFRG
jgi:uncharacterized alpha-E superfamily protein